MTNTLFDVLYPEDNTDDEQEDLPYDGDLQNRYQYNYVSQNLEEFPSVENASQSALTLTSSQMSYCSQEKSDTKTQLPQKKISLESLSRKNDIEFTMTARKELLTWDAISSGRNQHISNSKISKVLLRHFPKEELASSCNLIDSETIPEISFTESFDETIQNKTKSSGNARIFLSREEENNLEQKITCESVKKSFIQVEKFTIKDSINAPDGRKDLKENNSQLVTQKEDTISEELGGTSIPKDEYQEQKYLMEINGSSQNKKYSQHQVHYQLPDFSKIAPKIKIPKGKSNNKPNPIIKRAKTSPNLLGKSAVVKDILEAMNSLESVAAKNEEEEMRIAELDQHLEMLTKHAEAQNHIDHLRFNAKKLPSSNSHRTNFDIKGQGTGINSELSTIPPVTVPVKPMLSFSESPLADLQTGGMVSPLADARKPSPMNPFLLQKVTEERKLSEMLKEQTEEMKAKVETFSKCMTEGVLPAEERHQLLKLLKGQLDQLEQNYLTTKEKHCSLQLQSYKYSSPSIVEFDPDRKVEGEIFKLGMLLEGIGENIDKTCNHHSSTFVTSPSFTSPKSVSYSYSNCSESPVVSRSSHSPEKTAMEVNIKNEKYGENRSDHMEEKRYQQPSQGNGGHLFQPQNLSYWEMKSPPSANPCSTNHPESAPVGPSRSKEQGRPTYPTYPSNQFLEELGNSSKEHNIIIHPRLKIQLSSRPTCSCSSNRNKKEDYRKTDRGKSDCEQFSIFLEGKAADFNSSASSQKADTSFQRIYYKEPEQFIDRLWDRHNLHVPQTTYSKMQDTIIISPQYLGRRDMYGRRLTSPERNRHTSAAVLSSTLDGIIETANSLKRTSEHMMQVISEDLTKANIQTSSHVTRSQHSIGMCYENYQNNV
nr:PREDICTED: protein AKNAD1 isoform X2 [Anolis carolinensis]|eukprot:XP_016850697.1 PREDICTED: protein AKNAD1 isoform X2 [Anolis carolinensis]